MTNKTYLTKEGFEKLKQEISDIKTIQLKECVDAMAEAREKGDLSENAEYDAAKEQFDNLHDRINKLSVMLSNSLIINQDMVKCDVVQILTTVHLLNKKTKKELSYTIVPPTDTDVKSGKISVDSPVAQSLIGKAKGESVQVKLPSNVVLELEILDIKI